MKVLTIRQPWASLIMAGIKDVENRTWSTKLRGRFLVQSSGSIHEDEFVSAKKILFKERIQIKPTSAIGAVQVRGFPFACHLGAILGTVELTDVVTESDSPWFVGPVGFTLSNPQPFAEPIPAKGKLSFWTPDDDLQALIDAALEKAANN